MPYDEARPTPQIITVDDNEDCKLAPKEAAIFNFEAPDGAHLVMAWRGHAATLKLASQFPTPVEVARMVEAHPDGRFTLVYPRYLGTRMRRTKGLVTDKDVTYDAAERDVVDEVIGNMQGFLARIGQPVEDPGSPSEGLFRSEDPDPADQDEKSERDEGILDFDPMAQTPEEASDCEAVSSGYRSDHDGLPEVPLPRTESRLASSNDRGEPSSVVGWLSGLFAKKDEPDPVCLADCPQDTADDVPEAPPVAANDDPSEGRMDEAEPEASPDEDKVAALFESSGFEDQRGLGAELCEEADPRSEERDALHAQIRDISLVMHAFIEDAEGAQDRDAAIARLRGFLDLFRARLGLIEPMDKRNIADMKMMDALDEVMARRLWVMQQDLLRRP